MHHECDQKCAGSYAVKSVWTTCIQTWRKTRIFYRIQTWRETCIIYCIHTWREACIEGYLCCCARTRRPHHLHPHLRSQRIIRCYACVCVCMCVCTHIYKLGTHIYKRPLHLHHRLYSQRIIRCYACVCMYVCMYTHIQTSTSSSPAPVQSKNSMCTYTSF